MSRDIRRHVLSLCRRGPDRLEAAAPLTRWEQLRAPTLRPRPRVVPRERPQTSLSTRIHRPECPSTSQVGTGLTEDSVTYGSHLTRLTGSVYTVGGTSLATPLASGRFATVRASGKLDQFTPEYIYNGGAKYRDVTGECPARVATLTKCRTEHPARCCCRMGRSHRSRSMAGRHRRGRRDQQHVQFRCGFFHLFLFQASRIVHLRFVLHTWGVRRCEWHQDLSG